LKDLKISTIKPTDAPALSYLLSADAQGDRQYFVPFDTAPESLSTRLASARRDCYWGIFEGTRLVGMFMARGLDEGFAIPSFGVYIAQSFSRRGLSKLALQYTISWCLLNGITDLMLSVHPDNVYARRVYEAAGFEFTNQSSKLGHWIYIKRLSS